MNEQESTSEHLLARCAEGDAQAFEQLYQRVSPQVFAVLIKMVRRRDVAEDLLQDAFVKVWRKAKTFDARHGRALTWVISIARYGAIDLIRRSGREFSIAELGGDDDVLDNVGSDDSDAEQVAASQQDGQRLERCMGELNQQQRDGIRLAFIAGLSHAEVAQRLAAPLGTTKSWIRRGLQALKRCLGEVMGG